MKASHLSSPVIVLLLVVGTALLPILIGQAGKSVELLSVHEILILLPVPKKSNQTPLAALVRLNPEPSTSIKTGLSGRGWQQGPIA